MAVRQIKQQSLVQKAADELARLIGDGEWPVGTKIPNEQDLSTLLGVGRSTGREAVRALIASGQLYSHQGSGTYVMSSTPVTELERELKRSDRREVYEVRRLLEVEAGRLAAMRRTSADVDLLQAALEARENASTPTEFVDADMELHRAVGECCAQQRAVDGVRFIHRNPPQLGPGRDHRRRGARPRIDRRRSRCPPRSSGSHRRG